MALLKSVNRTYWIAYSGGLDSHVLLVLCQQLGMNCRAIHINHHLSPFADEWALHCAKVCEQLNIPFISESIHMDKANGDSLEAVAREKRYALLQSYLAPNDVLLTAHHQDDQAETLLLQLTRGAGLKGLAAMPLLKSFGKGYLGRPLLSFTRHELETYALEKKLNWIKDHSNDDTQLTRNFIRLEMMPLLKKRWPGIVPVLSRTAKHVAEAQALLEEMAETDWEKVKGLDPATLSCSKLLQLSASRQRLVLRYWIQKQGYALPNTKKLETICQTVLSAKLDRMPCVKWQNGEIRRYRDHLYLMHTLKQINTSFEMEWNMQDPLYFPGLGQLKARLVYGQGYRMDIKAVSVRLRQGGECIEIPTRGRLSLKNIFQEYGIPPWMRDRIPLIYVKDKLIGIMGYFIHDDYRVNNHQEGRVINWVNV